jgi:hypothetical protein
MLDKSIIRQKIINFFTTECNNKLNKNVYYENFYALRNKKEIFFYIQNYFNGTVLENAPLAQKYYHIYWNIPPENIPDKRFCNFVKGYLKGKVTYSAKKLNWFIENVNNFIPDNNEKISLNDKTVKEKIKNYIKKVSYKKFIMDKNLLNFVFNRQFPEILKNNFEKIIFYFYGSGCFCKCGSLKEIKSFNYLLKTCNNKKCKHDCLSEAAKIKDISFLFTEEIQRKRLLAKKNYKHSEETKQKIKESNKKIWTEERKQKQQEQIIENKISERMSEIMKNKIFNGEFTPCTQNRLNHKRLKSEITNIQTYRSSWELIFHEQNTHLEYETLRIEYYYNNEKKIYIVDFWDPIKRIAIEIKPSNLLIDEKTKAKINFLKNWCLKNNATYKVITEKEFNFYGQ